MLFIVFYVNDADDSFVFTNHTLKLLPDMSFYLSTDGFPDQKGGPKGFSFGKKKFATLLKDQSYNPFAQQRENLWQAFQDYKREHERLDGIRLQTIPKTC